MRPGWQRCTLPRPGAYNANGVYSIRQALIDGGQPWRSAEGLGVLDGPNSDSPDKHEENLGWAPAGDMPTSPPTVEIISPAAGATVSGQILVSVTATTDWRLTVQQVEFTFGATTQVDDDGSDDWSVSWDTGALADAVYAVSAVVTDSQGQTAGDQITVTVDNTVRSMNAALSGLAVWINKTTWEARVTITVLDAANNPLAGANVIGTWSNGKLATGVTDADGRITLVSDRFRGAGNVTWTLTGVSLGGYLYEGGVQSITVRFFGNNHFVVLVGRSVLSRSPVGPAPEGRESQGASPISRRFAGRPGC